MEKEILCREEAPALHQVKNPRKDFSNHFSSPIQFVEIFFAIIIHPFVHPSIYKSCIQLQPTIKIILAYIRMDNIGRGGAIL